MTSMLSSLFSRDPRANFAYELPIICFYSEEGISIGKTMKKTNNEDAVCFWSSSNSYGEGGSNLKVQIQNLKMLRHPNVLIFLDSLETDTMIYLITEPCRPLSIYIEDAKWNDTQKELVVSWGLYQVLNGLKFLHQDVKLSHENLRKSVFVTDSGDWKLSNFDKSIDFRTSKNDMNSLGLLIWEIFNGFRSGSFGKCELPKKIPKILHIFYKKMVSSEGHKLSAEDLISELRVKDGFMGNKYVDTLLFFDEIQLKEYGDKCAFFAHLHQHLGMFPDDLAKCKILPKLISAYEYGDAGSSVLIPLFQLGSLLTEPEYQSKLVPCLVKLFSSPDRVTRMKLLDKIDQLAPHLSSAVINDTIYTNLSTGFLDTNPAVRENTIKAMVILGEKLNSHNLNVDLMKYLARLQGGDDQPGIRTNTTISLGKLAPRLDPKHRQRILISAFLRALRDPFPPARVAALLALSATQQFYSLVDVSNRVLPLVVPLTCDPEKLVRNQAFKAMRGFLDKLEKASENPDSIATLEAQVQAGVGSTQEKLPHWANWALTALSAKFHKTPAQNDAAAVEKKHLEAKDSKVDLKQQKSMGDFDESSELEKKEGNAWEEEEEEEEKQVTKGEQVEDKEPLDAEDDVADWSSGWETLPLNASSGSLKLDSGEKSPINFDDDLDSWLGTSATHDFTISDGNTKKNDGWHDFDHSSSWDDNCQLSKNASSREFRKHELALKNEERRRILAAKKQARKTIKLATRNTSS